MGRLLEIVFTLTTTAFRGCPVTHSSNFRGGKVIHDLPRSTYRIEEREYGLPSPLLSLRRLISSPLPRELSRCHSQVRIGIWLIMASQCSQLFGDAVLMVLWFPQQFLHSCAEYNKPLAVGHKSFLEQSNASETGFIKTLCLIIELWSGNHAKG